MQLISAVVVSTALLVVACSRPLGRAPTFLAGTFDLAELNGQPLPINRGPIVDRAGRRTGCDFILDHGRLSLDPERQRYDLHYFIRSSCDGQILSVMGAIGSYTHTGSTLVFEIPSIDQPRQFRGSVHPHAITVQFDGSMVFRLPGRASVSSIRGTFSWRVAPGRSMPAEPGGTAGAGCSLIVDSVSLELTPDPSARAILGPATGHFSLSRAVRDSCTGRVTRRFEEPGSYEQIARAIYFEAYPAPQTVRRFRGVIVSDDEIDIIAGGGSPAGRFSR